MLVAEVNSATNKFTSPAAIAIAAGVFCGRPDQNRSGLAAQILRDTKSCPHGHATKG